jgi:hypothetical protein
MRVPGTIDPAHEIFSFTGFFGDCAAEKVAFRADLIPAQSSKKRDQLAVSCQLLDLA